MDLISNLNALAAESGPMLSSVRTQEAEVCHAMYAEKNLQEMLYEQEQLLQSLDNEIRLLSSTIQLASNSPIPSTQPPLSSPAPTSTPQLLRARSTPSRSLLLSPLSQRSPSISLPLSASFGE